VPQAMIQAFKCVRKGGTVVLFSVPEAEAVFQLRPFDIFQKELTIKGSFTNPSTHDRTVRLISSKRINLKPFITHRFPLNSITNAFYMQSVLKL
jgi:threonine dehydrogenase-like Zn-dependent dehydrogenase